MMVLMFWSSSELWAKDIRLFGKITDKNHQAVFAANIYLSAHPHLLTASDEEGCFQLNIPERFLNDSLVVSFIGYKSHRKALKDLPINEFLEIVLQEDWTRLDAVVLEQNPEVSEEFSLEKMDRLEIYLSPVAAGDPLNALTVLPAATNTVESANPSFRGSEAQASQVVLNGINISNPVRNTQMSGMGNFSLFNTELIQSLRVHAGNPPLSFGNSLAGLVDIKSTKQLQASQTQIALSMANIGVLRSQKIGEKAFVQLYGNYQFSGPYLYLNDCQDMLSAFSSRDLGINTHATWKKSSFNYYAYFINEDYQGKEFYQHQLRNSEAWKRRLFGVFNWHYAHQRLFFELNAGHNHSFGRMQVANIDASMAEANYQLNTKLKYFVSDALYLQAGLSNEFMEIDYCQKGEFVEESDSCLHYQLPEAFAYLRWKKERVSLGCGLRSMLTRQEKSEGPMLAGQTHLRYQIDGGSSLQASVGQYYAYCCHSSGDAHIDLQKSRQYALEYDARYGNTHLSAACYHKKENGDVYFAEQGTWQTCQRQMSGLELSWEQEWNGLKLGTSYSFLHSHFRWNGQMYPAANDLPYWLKWLISYTDEHLFTIACNAQLRAGLRYTPVVEGIWQEATQTYLPIYGAWNSSRLDNYQRVDLSLNRVFMLKKNSMLVAFASLNNIFNHHNQAAVLYRQDFSEQIASVPMQLYSIYFGLQWSF